MVFQYVFEKNTLATYFLGKIIFYFYTSVAGYSSPGLPLSRTWDTVKSIIVRFYNLFAISSGNIQGPTNGNQEDSVNTYILTQTDYRKPVRGHLLFGNLCINP